MFVSPKGQLVRQFIRPSARPVVIPKPPAFPANQSTAKARSREDKREEFECINDLKINFFLFFASTIAPSRHRGRF
jgi:hypothetical protein